MFSLLAPSSYCGLICGWVVNCLASGRALAPGEAPLRPPSSRCSAALGLPRRGMAFGVGALPLKSWRNLVRPSRLARARMHLQPSRSEIETRPCQLFGRDCWLRRSHVESLPCPRVSVPNSMAPPSLPDSQYCGASPAYASRDSPVTTFAGVVYYQDQPGHFTGNTGIET